MINWIYNKLLQIRSKKKQEILKLKWEQAELEQKLKQMKSE